MTAHELARKLLEGPDLPVTRFYFSDGRWWEMSSAPQYYGETERYVDTSGQQCRGAFVELS